MITGRVADERPAPIGAGKDSSPPPRHALGGAPGLCTESLCFSYAVALPPEWISYATQLNSSLAFAKRGSEWAQFR
ncbi:protein of unknown function [Rhodovastum atsumiense]|nr:protein of unknown function [Rhodovastum atsumiense]